MKSALANKRFFFSSFILLSLSSVWMLLNFDGTGGGGDSVMHFLFAKYAGLHPENLLDHWAKPFFTLLAWPFAQFGFTGIKVFNLLCSAIAIYYSYKMMEHWDLANRGLLAIFIASMSLFVSVCFSGLTEPLSAAMLCLSIYLVISQRLTAGLLLISFIPFVRSEGLIILGVFGCYLISSKHYTKIPLLLFGHIIYSIAGYPYYKDILWVFTKIPYSKPTELYGKGPWIHFVEQLNFQTSPLLFGLFWIGCLYFLFILINSKKHKNYTSTINARLWLVYGNFFAFLIAHSAFWALGLFNSLGLVRVLVSVLPLFAIIAIDGLNCIYLTPLPQKASKVIMALLTIGICLIPFTKGNYQHKFPGDYRLTPDQQLLANEVNPFIQRQFSNKQVIYLDPNIPFLLNLDPFGANDCDLYVAIDKPGNLSAEQVLIVDPWFARIEWGHPIEEIKGDSNLNLVKTFPAKASPDEAQYFIFTKK